MSRKASAAVKLGGLALGLAAVNMIASPNLGWWLNQDLSTWLGIGQSVGTALAHAFGNSLFELVGIILFVA